MTKLMMIWVLTATIAIMLLGWRSRILHDLLIEQQGISQELIDTLNLQAESLEIIDARTARTQDLSICNSLALREAARDLMGASSRANGWFKGCVE